LWLTDRILGVILLFFGLVNTLFAERLVNYSIHLKSSKIMHFDQWPAWMVSSLIWMIRFAGIFTTIGGILLIMRGWK